MSSVQLSVVIPVSRPEQFLQCISGFAAQAGNYWFEVIGVGAVEGIESPYPFVKLLPFKNPHPNTRRNEGVRNAAATLIALMDDDAVPTASWVQTAIETATGSKGKVITGPEVPPSNASWFAFLTHRLLSSGVVEFTQTHINTAFTKVKWYEVPFCNCVFEKNLWQSTSGFSETIPWHMDDFHFFFGHRHHTSFMNVPNLLIEHNRYPESFKKLIAYKWKLRKETGEKLVTHPQMYFRALPVAIASIVPLPVFIILLFAALYYPSAIAIAAVFYLAVVFVVCLTAIKKATIGNLLTAVAILGSIQVVTVAAIYAGFSKQLFNKLLSNPKQM
jgi:hypothetical protein